MRATRIILLWVLMGALSAVAQTTETAHKADAPPNSVLILTNEAAYLHQVQEAETVRTNCIQGRRIICGKIIKVLPTGFVIDSGYTSLMRQPLDHSWLIPGTVEAEREPNLVEKNEPDCICVGLVFLTSPPKLRRIKPKLYDYVVCEGFPAGGFTYNSVGTVQHTVRRFSGSLTVAVRLNLESEQK